MFGAHVHRSCLRLYKLLSMQTNVLPMPIVDIDVQMNTSVHLFWYMRVRFVCCCCCFFFSVSFVCRVFCDFSELLQSFVGSQFRTYTYCKIMILCIVHIHGYSVRCSIIHCIRIEILATNRASYRSAVSSSQRTTKRTIKT